MNPTPLFASLVAIGLLVLAPDNLRAGEIHDAAVAGDLPKVRALFEADPALLESKDKDGNTPLISACFAPPSFIPREAVASFLIERGANVKARNDWDGTPLYCALRNPVLVRRLIEKGADVNARAFGADGLTPLQQAAAIGELETAKLLIEHGAELNARSSDGTILHNVIKRKGNASLDLTKLLLELGARLQEFSFGNTELHLAALQGSADIAALLIRHGADVNAANDYGHTALFYAARHGYHAVADILIAAGAHREDIVEQNYGAAPQLAAELPDGEAHLWFLGGLSPGTGYAVKTKEHLLIFDPCLIDDSDEAGLANGHLHPQELAGQKLTVFFTRSLHRGPSASDLAQRFPGANLVLGFTPAATGDKPMPVHRVAGPHESFAVGNIQVHTVAATGRHYIEGVRGVGYLVEVDGLKIFHAGLHAASANVGEVAAYRREVDHLARCGPIDIAILPIRGRHISIDYEPYLYLIDQLTPKAIYLIGDDLTTEEHRKCLEVLRARNVRVLYPDGGIAVGQRFYYVRAQARGKPESTNPAQATSASVALRLDFSTFLGGSGEDRAHGMAVDALGNIYLTAPVDSKDFPTTADALCRMPTGLYFAKLSATGALLYSTYLGAVGGISYVHGVALDREGCIYLAGNTTNPDFPTTAGAFQTTFKGPSSSHHGDAFVIKLSPAGDRVIYSTLLGGTNRDMAGKIAVDAAGNAYVLGSTSSADFPVTAGTFQTAFKGGEATPAARGDVFVAKISPDGSRLVYCTLVGGNGIDQHGANLVIDSAGAVCFAVTTTSTDFPTTANAWSRSFRGGAGERGGGDAVVVKLAPTGGALEYSSYVGGSGVEYGTQVAFDPTGNLWLAGETLSPDFPTTEHAYSRALQGSSDVFFVRLDPRSGALIYASLLGGSRRDQFPALAVDPTGKLVLAGGTESADFPTTDDAQSKTLQGPADLFVTVFDPATNSLRASTLLGGSGSEVPGPLVIANGAVYLAGNTTSADFPVTPGAGDTTYNGGKSEWGGDAFVARFALSAAPRRADLPSAPARTEAFQGLGDLSGGDFHSLALQVSDDGVLVVGSSIATSGQQAFRWTQPEGMVSLGNLPGGGFKQSCAVGVSAEASVIVGYGDPEGSGAWEKHQGFRWTKSGGMVLLRDTSGPTREAFAVSADGPVIVGDGGMQAFRWTQSGGMTNLGVLPGRTSSRAIAVSADGSVVTGSSYDLPSWDKEEAFVWTLAGGMEGLGIPPGNLGSYPNAISADGSVVVGTLSAAGVFRWSRGTGLTRLGHFPGAKVTHPSAVTADGAIIVGTAFTDRRAPGTAFIWDVRRGMRALKDVLETEHGLNVSGWHLQNASDITPDGSVIIGWGTNPAGQTEAFRVALAAPRANPNTASNEP